MGGERYSSKTDVKIKLILVFFISLLSFSIGTFVGKKFSDNQHKIAQYEPTSNEETAHDEEAGEESTRDVASVPHSNTEVKPGKALTDSEVAKLAEEFVTDETETAGAAPAGEHLKTDKNTTHSTEAKSSHESKDSANAAPAKKAIHDEPLDKALALAQERTPSSAPPAHATSPDKKKGALPAEAMPSAAGKFTVQIAAFPTEAEAEKLAGDLKAKEFSAFYVAARSYDKKTQSEKTWYKVSVGLFATRKEAEDYLADLKNRGKVTAAFVQTIPN